MKNICLNFMINWLGLDNNVAPNGALFVWGDSFYHNFVPMGTYKNKTIKKENNCKTSFINIVKIENELSEI